jgi:hypothetical protein
MPPPAPPLPPAPASPLLDDELDELDVPPTVGGSLQPKAATPSVPKSPAIPSERSFIANSLIDPAPGRFGLCSNEMKSPSKTRVYVAKAKGSDVDRLSP